MKIVNMPATEVRIGNLFYSVRPKTGDKVVSVTDITREGFLCDSDPADDLHAAEIFAPIPIDEGWLISFGFQFKEKTGLSSFYALGDVGVSLFEGALDFGFIDDGVFNNLKDAYYLHELQNLYWAMTGNDLKVRENTVIK